MLRWLVLLASLGFAIVAISSSGHPGQPQPAGAAVIVRGIAAPARLAASRSACLPSMRSPVMPGAGSLVWRACDGSVVARFDYGASTTAGAAYNETAVFPSIPGTVAQMYLGLFVHSVSSGLTYVAPRTDSSQIVSQAIIRGSSYKLVGFAVMPGDKAHPFHVIYRSGVYTATSVRVIFIKSPLAGLTIPRSVQVYFALLAVRHVGNVGPSPTDTPASTARAVVSRGLPALALANTDNSYGAWMIGYSNAQYTLTIGNAGAVPTVGTIIVRDKLPSGLTLSAAPSGTGWRCSGGPGGTVVSCGSTTSIGAHAGGAPIAVPVSIGPSTPIGINSITNTASAYGGGDPVHATENTGLIERLLTTIDRPNTTATVFLVNPANTRWQVPSDWNPDDNTIEVIGGGAAGGGGGAYSKVVNVTLTRGSIMGRAVGAGADPLSGALGGGDTYMCSSVSNCGSLSASAVLVGAQGGSASSGLGGSAAAGVGTVRFSGGNGNFYGGGGGAAGRHGNGDDADAFGNGGAGDAGFGGGGGGAGSDGGNGSEFDAAHGSGGGGGYSSGYYGGSGGNYGGGGGNTGDEFDYFPGYGGGGLIVISYVPTASTRPALTLSKIDNSGGAWVIGAPSAQYTLTVGNAGTGSTVGTITVTDTLPSGLQLRAKPSGTGWICTGAPSATVLTCTSKTPIPKGSSGVPITVPVSIGPATPTGVKAISNTALAYGGGDPVRSTPSDAARAQLATTVFGSAHVNVFVSEDVVTGNSGVVQEILPDGGTPVTLATIFADVGGIAVDRAGNVFVSEYAYDSNIEEIIAAGGYKTVNALRPGLYVPFGVAVDRVGNVYVADAGNNAVKEILAEGGYVTLERLGAGFYDPMGVAVDGAGNVYVADTGYNAVKEIMAAGGYKSVRTIHSGFNQPYSVALDSSGNIYVADNKNSAVKEILAAGGYTAVKTVGSGFSYPQGVAVDGAGNVYVADTGNGAVKEILAAGGTTVVLGAGLQYPVGIALELPALAPRLPRRPNR